MGGSWWISEKNRKQLEAQWKKFTCVATNCEGSVNCCISFHIRPILTSAWPRHKCPRILVRINMHHAYAHKRSCLFWILRDPEMNAKKYILRRINIMFSTYSTTFQHSNRQSWKRQLIFSGRHFLNLTHHSPHSARSSLRLSRMTNKAPRSC